MPSTALVVASIAYGAAAIKTGGDPDFNRIGKDPKDGYNPWAKGKGHEHLAKPTEKPWAELSQACTCKNWKEVYAQKLRCGATLEYFSANRRAPANMTEVESLDAQLREKICTGIYEKQDNNVCLNVNVGDDLGQWCFVSDECKDVEDPSDPEGRHGGEAITIIEGTGLAWKYCRDHADKRWRTKSPEEIGVIAQLLEADLGMLIKMSYPLYKFGLWKEVMGMWNINQYDNRKKLHGWVVEGNLHDDAEQIIASKEYTIFNTKEDGSAPYVVTQGKHIWMVSLDENLNKELRQAAGLKIFPMQ